MTTIEGNKLIAEFMGYDYHKGLFIHREAKTPIGNTIKPDELKYHSSWDWLMPVVEKIEDDFAKDIEVVIYSSSCYIKKFDNRKGYYETLVSGTGKKIEAVYDSVVQFIQWYNTQTTTPSLPGDNNLK